MNSNIPAEILNITIEDLLLKERDGFQRHILTRIYNALKYSDKTYGYIVVNTVGDLMQYSQCDLLKYPDFGRKSVAVLVELLIKEYGITLPMYRDNRPRHNYYKPCQKLSMYAMQPNERKEVSRFLAICRVPGGWIYETRQGSCFVPYSAEFSEVSNDR
jgi:hypothetical protein